MKLYLGVDGGQSGTTAVIGDGGGRVLGTGEAGPCNHAAAGEGRAKLERAVKESVHGACAQASLDPASAAFEAACFGMSGGPDDKREIVASALRAEHLMMTDDAVIALAGATRSGQGIITIAGTGSIAFGRNAAGRSARAGGWGYVFGDEGGAFDIARQAARCALRMEEGWGPRTSLLERMLEATGSATANQMLHRFYTDEWPRSRVATLAPLVDATGVEGDGVAAGIMRNAAQQLAMLAGAVRGMLWTGGESVEVAYIGGVFESATARDAFRSLVELTDGVRCAPAWRSPAMGALREAYRSVGLEQVFESGA
ncbi:MAG: BadF/BadG/BcrA/BcrD ATPase family protein [Candidatus Solibacter sp.]